MAKDLVLIPTWRRDDFLHVTLENIVLANSASEKCYIFLIDRAYQQNVIDVINKFPFCKEIRFAPHHRYSGNSFNVLEGYKFAYEASQRCQSNLIYLIEEDIWIGKDFFDFHEKIQSKMGCFCLSACRCQNDTTIHDDDPAAIYYHKTFQSLGLSWKPEMLGKVVQHAKPAYYNNMRGYIKSLAPKSVYGDSWSEQDGLINRLVELSDIKCLYPYVPRAYHAGFVGYNRPGVHLAGPLEDRVAKLKSMSGEEMNTLANTYKDISPSDIKTDYGISDFVLKETQT